MEDYTMSPRVAVACAIFAFAGFCAGYSAGQYSGLEFDRDSKPDMVVVPMPSKFLSTSEGEFGLR